MFKGIFLVFCICISSVMLQNYTLEPTDLSITLMPQQPVVPTTNLSAEVKEALLLSNVTMTILNGYVSHKLPPSLQTEAETILVEAKEGLTYCESSLKRNEDIWQYKVCSSAQLQFGIAALSTLKERYYKSNAATNLLTSFSVILCVLMAIAEINVMG